MKRLLIIILTTLIAVTLTLSGCGGSQEAIKPDSSQNSASNPVQDEELDKAMEDLGDALEMLATPGWPTGKISDKIPEYPYGEVKNSGPGDEGEYFLLISPTNKEELANYMSTLEAQGFTLSGDDRARLETTALNFQFNTSDTLQILISEVGTSEWPDFPGDLLPPDQGTIYGEVYIPELTESDNSMGQYYSAGFSLVDLTEEDCLAFVRKQVENGWENAGIDMAKKELEFDGVTCELVFQFVQFYDGQADFLLEAWQKQ